MPEIKAMMKSLRFELKVQRPSGSDLMLGLGAMALCGAILLVIGLPAFHRLEDQARLAALKGNAATLQLAAESYASQNLGAYPTDPLDLIPYLPGDHAPNNPLTGNRIVFRNQPGDVTYNSPSGGGDYVIRAWGFGPGQGTKVLVTLCSSGG